MDASPLPEILIGVDPHEEPQLPLATEGVLRYVWKSKFGPILIEVKAGDAFVNGGRVEPLSETIQALEWRSASPVAERA